MSASYQRRLPVVAELVPQGGVHFRVWAPRRKRVEVAFEDGGRAGSKGDLEAQPLQCEAEGYFSTHVATAQPGSLYRFRLDSDSTLYPDPASRFQPQGPHGPSQVVDPGRFAWTDGTWEGVRRDGQVIYELHLGTF